MSFCELLLQLYSTLTICHHIQLLNVIKLEVEKVEALGSAGELHAHNVWSWSLQIPIYP